MAVSALKSVMQGETLNDTDEHELVLTIPGDSKYLAAMRAVISEAVELSGLDEDDGKKIVLAVGEAVTNVICHCYQLKCRPLTLRCVFAPGRFEVRLRDYGPKPPPSKLKSRKLEDVRPGGLGIHIM